MAQIIDEADAPEAIANLKQNGNFVVYHAGCYEVLHTGHLACFTAGKSHQHHGQRTKLVVGVESDSTLRLNRSNKDRPLSSQAERINVIANIATVDLVIRLNPNQALDYADVLAFATRLRRLAPDAMVISYNDALPYFTELMQVQAHECAEAGVLILPVVHSVRTHATDAIDLIGQKSFFERSELYSRWQSRSEKASAK